MSVDTKAIRAQRHLQLAAIIQQDSAVIIERWSMRAIAEQPQARRVHHQTLLDHLPLFLDGLAQTLGESRRTDTHAPPAHQHGIQRWEEGWSLSEVVQDYQLLRIVLVDHLERRRGRPIRSQEIMAIGLALDEAISVSVIAYSQAKESRLADISMSLQKHNEELVAIEKRRNEFLAILGHELRNPLAPLRNAVALLHLDGGNRETLDTAVAVMDRQSALMARLVDDLLDFSRMAQDKLRLNLEPLDFVGIVRHVLADWRTEVAAAQLTLSENLPSGLAMAHGDRTRLFQIVTNLLGNARKFTAPGGQIHVRLEDSEDQLRLTIRDSGIGIEPTLLPHVFETFAQGRDSLTHGRTGLGLGLAIVRRLVELHGGTVSASSDGPGCGAEFIVRLPRLGDVAVSGG